MDIKPLGKKGMGSLDPGKWLFGFIGIYLVMAFMINLLPSLKTLITDALGNFTAAEGALLALVPTIVIFGGIYVVYAALMKK